MSAITETGFALMCLACRLDGDSFTERAEVVHLAGVHNDLHHGSRPEAFAVPLSASIGSTEAGRQGSHD